MFAVHANKVGKELLNLYAETFEMIDYDDEKSHLGWFLNLILVSICLQIRNRKDTLKQKANKLKGTIELIRSGRLKTVTAESMTIQHAMKKKKRTKKHTKMNWISNISNKIHEGKLNCAARILNTNA